MLLSAAAHCIALLGLVAMLDGSAQRIDLSRRPGLSFRHTQMFRQQRPNGHPSRGAAKYQREQAPGFAMLKQASARRTRSWLRLGHMRDVCP